jgi:hypothetical protein
MIVKPSGRRSTHQNTAIVHTTSSRIASRSLPTALSHRACSEPRPDGSSAAPAMKPRTPDRDARNSELMFEVITITSLGSRCSTLSIGWGAAVEHLQEQVEHVGVRLLDLVEEQVEYGFSPHTLGELAGLVVADIVDERAVSRVVADDAGVLRAIGFADGTLVDIDCGRRYGSMRWIFMGASGTAACRLTADFHISQPHQIWAVPNTAPDIIPATGTKGKPRARYAVALIASSTPAARGKTAARAATMPMIAKPSTHPTINMIMTINSHDVN